MSWRDPATAKRVLDVVGASAVLVATSPLLVVAALAVRLDSSGPALFRQVRVGRHGQEFVVLKFRTMVCDADESVHREYVLGLLNGAQEADPRTYKVDGDARVTRAGRVLRRTSLDELPQLFNVMRSEMSLVGPRPDVPYAVAAYQPWQRRRLDVLPGMTGLWQVSGRSRRSPAEMLDLDVQYVERWSLSLDVAILLRTLPALLAPGSSR